MNSLAKLVTGLGAALLCQVGFADVPMKPWGKPILQGNWISAP